MNPVWVRNLIYPLHEKIMKRDTFACLSELEQQQWLTPVQLEEVRLHKLRALLLHAQNRIPFYRERFAKAGFNAETVQSPDDLQTLPLLVSNKRYTDMHPTIIQNAPEIAEICRHYGVRRLYLFGSAAHGTDFDPDRSDADFLVEFEVACCAKRLACSGGHGSIISRDLIHSG